MNKLLRTYLAILLLSFVLFYSNLGSTRLFDWDEINFAEAAREMIVTNNYSIVQINYQIFHEKPPLFIWMQALSMNIFGINEFAARLPNAIIGTITLFFLFNIGRKIKDERFGIFWVLCYLGSFLPNFYFKTALIDPTFNLFIFVSLFLYYKFLYLKEEKFFWISGFFCGLAILTKGPVGLLLAFLTLVLYLVITKLFNFKSFLKLILYSFISLIPIVIWYSIVLLNSPTEILNDFISYQIRLLTTSDAGHSGPVYYHFIILLFGCFPASIFALQSLKLREDNFHLLNLILLSVVLIVFSIVKTKILHYSSLAYFPITFLGALSIYNLDIKSIKQNKFFQYLFLTIGLILSLAFAGLPLFIKFRNSSIFKINDEFTKLILSKPIIMGGYEEFVGLFLFMGVLASFLLLKNSNIKNALIIISLSVAFTIFLFLPITAPKIEHFTQATPISYMQSLKGKDAYIEILGYKSYAHYFYSEIMPRNSTSNLKNINNKTEYLLKNKLNKDAYFIIRTTDIKDYLMYNLDTISINYGFALLKKTKN